jgi:hypothetical protein
VTCLWVHSALHKWLVAHPFSPAEVVKGDNSQRSSHCQADRYWNGLFLASLLINRMDSKHKGVRDGCSTTQVHSTPPRHHARLMLQGPVTHTGCRPPHPYSPPSELYDTAHSTLPSNSACSVLQGFIERHRQAPLLPWISHSPVLLGHSLLIHTGVSFIDTCNPDLTLTSPPWSLFTDAHRGVFDTHRLPSPRPHPPPSDLTLTNPPWSLFGCSPTPS